MLTGWQTVLDSAQLPLETLSRELREPAAAQARLLDRIMRQNAQSEFGRRHQFTRVNSPADFRNAVPITTYEDYRDPILKIADGAQNVLTADEVVAFEQTGGTSSGAKLIPYTSASLQDFRAAVLPWLADLVRHRPQVAEGRCYVSISPATRQIQHTPSGIPIGLQSEAAYLGPDLINAFVSILAVPPEVVESTDMDQWRRATLAALIACPDLCFVSVWSPTFFTMLLQSLEDETVSSMLEPHDRERLDLALSAKEPSAVHLWPNLSVISCWTDGSSQALAQELAGLCPHSCLLPKGLLATEAAVTIPFGLDEGGIPAITSTFLEFVDSENSVRLVHELAPGETYRVLITTTGGLYRYDLGDQMRCVSVDGVVPRLVFEGRSGMQSDLVGEKLEEAFVAKALSKISTPAMLVATTGPPRRYELWLERPVDTHELEALAMQVESKLRENPQYSYARDLNQLEAVQAVVRPGFIARIQRERTAAGARLGDLKHTALAPVGFF